MKLESVLPGGAARGQGNCIHADGVRFVTSLPPSGSGPQLPSLPNVPLPPWPACGGSGVLRMSEQRFRTCLDCLGQGHEARF